MMRLNIKTFGFLVLFITKSIFAVRYDSIIVFGDSYSDNGSGVFNISNGLYPPSPPYFEGRFSDGPVWVEYLSKKLDLPLYDKAAGGATTDSMTIPSESGLNDEIIVPGIRQQVQEYVGEAHANGISNKGNMNLYVVVPLGYDYIYSIKHDLKMIEPVKIVGQLIANLQTLYIEVGATHFLMSTIPKFDEFPAFSKSDKSKRETWAKLVEDHNKLLREAIVVFLSDFKKVKFHVLETDKFFEQFPSQQFNESCLTIDHNGSHVCDHPTDFLFWDNLHITTRVHEILSSKVMELLA